MNKEEYEALKAMGYLWEFYPQATGNWEVDKDLLNKKKE